MAGTVLLAIDSSPQSEAAFEWYLYHLHQAGNKLVVLHCVDLSAISVDDDSADALSSQWDKQETKIKEIEGSYRWKLNEVGICGKIRTEGGKPGEVIVKTAKEEGASLIVIGSRGLSKVKRALVGSVSDYVLHNAHCPVCICKNSDQIDT